MARPDQQHEHHHHHTPESTYQPTTTSLTVLLIFIPSILLLLPRHNANTSSHHRLLRGDNQSPRWRKILQSWIRGDPIIWFWALVLFIIPQILFLFDISIAAIIGASSDNNNTGVLKRLVRHLAKPLGYSATVILSLFLVPVAKQSPLLLAMGWSPVQALGLHIWAGRLCAFFIAGHGGYYIVSIIKNPKQRMFLKECWTIKSPLAYQTESSNNDCYHFWRNAMGLIAGLALLILVMTSWNWVRRWNYRFFYVSHIITGFLMLFFTVLHYWWTAVYITPGLIYYAACSMPVVIQLVAHYCLDGGTMLKESTILAQSNGCFELVFPITNTRNMPAPSYVRICVPKISLLWHPFTVVPKTSSYCHNNNDDENDGAIDQQQQYVRLLIRKEGYFTTALYDMLQQSPPPTVLVDGMYNGPDWVEAALGHDAVLLVSGGVGVTPMLALVVELHKILKERKSCGNGTGMATRRVSFHWYCRDAGLIRHVLLDYLGDLFQEFEEAGGEKESECDCQFEIVVHYTAMSVDDEAVFELYEDTETVLSSKPSSSLSSPLCLSPSASLIDSSSGSDNDDEAVVENTGVGNYGSVGGGGDPDCNMRFVSNAKFPVKGATMEGAQLGSSRIVTMLSIVGLWVAYGLHCVFYATQVNKYRHHVIFRAYGIYGWVLLLVMMGVLSEWIRRRCDASRQSTRPSLRLIPSDSEEDVADSCHVERTNDTGVNVNDDDDERKKKNRRTVPHVGRSGKYTSMEIQVLSGRPLVHNVIDGVVEGECPGAFYCGPKELMRMIQKTIRSERRGKHGLMGASCCTYQEHFEM